MTEQEAFEIAVPIVRVVVDYIANKSYEKIPDVVGFSNGNSLQLIVTAINQFMDDAGITYMDTYDTPCKNGPDRYHEQLNVIVYSDGRGFAVDYFLATNGEINDLTLQMEFLVDSNGNYNPFIEDCHVL